jgi:hypothetical protein
MHLRYSNQSLSGLCLDDSNESKDIICAVLLAGAAPPMGLGMQEFRDDKNPLATKWLTPLQLANLAKTQGILYRKGKFSAEEDQLMHSAIQSYQQVSDFLIFFETGTYVSLLHQTAKCSQCSPTASHCL